jgi:hypothetical protein
MRRRRWTAVQKGGLWVSLALAAWVAQGCSTIALFSETAYRQTTAVKAEALILMGKANEPFEQHHAEVAALRLDIEKAYEYAKGEPKNTLTTRQWEILKDPKGNLLGGFLARWQKEGTISPTFIEDKRDQVSKAFDEITGLETGKNKPAAPKNP